VLIEIYKTRFIFLRRSDMTIKRTIQLSVIMGLAALAFPLAQAWAMEHMNMPMHKESTPKALTLEQLNAKQLPSLVQALENARKAVDMGHKEHALMELKKVEDLVAVVQRTLAQHVKPAFANTVCPIMGSKIDTSKLPASLIREFNGQKVGFCCAGCPAQWDKLTDAQKQARLAKTKAAATKH
jgi:hypothetical protein